MPKRSLQNGAALPVLKKRCSLFLPALFWAPLLLPYFEEANDIARLKCVCKYFANSVPQFVKKMHLVLNKILCRMAETNPETVQRFFEHATSLQITVRHPVGRIDISFVLPIVIKNVVFITINGDLQNYSIGLFELQHAKKCTNLFLNGPTEYLPAIFMPTNLDALWLHKTYIDFFRFQLQKSPWKTLHLRKLSIHDEDGLKRMMESDNVQPTTFRTIIYYQTKCELALSPTELYQKLGVVLQKAETPWPLVS